jgi:hypothetical protein
MPYDWNARPPKGETMNLTKTAIAAATVAMIAAPVVHAGSKQPSEATFRKALDEKLAHENRSCFARVSRDTGRFWVGRLPAFAMDCRNNQCTQLQAAGLIEMAKAGSEQFYKVTDAAKPFLTPTEGDHLFCFAKARAEKVIRWSEPMQMPGVTISEVTYTLKFENVPTWAQSPDMQKAFPEIGTALSRQGKEEKATARLFSDGWRFE